MYCYIYKDVLHYIYIYIYIYILKYLFYDLLDFVTIQFMWNVQWSDEELSLMIDELKHVFPKRISAKCNANSFFRGSNLV